MGGGVSRFVAVAAARHDRGEARRLIARAAALSAALGAVWMLAFVAGGGLFVRLFHVPAVWAGETRRALAVFGVSLVAFSTGQVFQWSLMGFQRLDLWNLFFLIGLVVHAGVMAAGLAAGGGLLATAFAALAGHVVVLVLSLAAVSRRVRALGPAESDRPTRWRELIGFGAVVQISNAFSIGQLQAGRVLLGLLGSLSSVARFELGFRVANTMWSVSSLLQIAAFPAATHAFVASGDRGARDVYSWCCRWVFLLSGATLGFLWVSAPALYRLWLGEADPHVIGTARTLVLAFALATLGGPATPIARAIGRPGLEALHFGVALLVNALAALWLVPRAGQEGAAAAMAIGYAAGSTALLVVFHRRIGMPFGTWLGRLALPRLGPALLAAVVVGFATARFPAATRLEALATLAIQGVAFVLAYVALVWPSGEPAAVARRLRALLAPRGPAGGGAPGSP